MLRKQGGLLDDRNEWKVFLKGGGENVPELYAAPMEVEVFLGCKE